MNKEWDNRDRVLGPEMEGMLDSIMEKAIAIQNSYTVKPEDCGCPEDEWMFWSGWLGSNPEGEAIYTEYFTCKLCGTGHKTQGLAIIQGS